MNFKNIELREYNFARRDRFDYVFGQKQDNFAQDYIFSLHAYF